MVISDFGFRHRLDNIVCRIRVGGPQKKSAIRSPQSQIEMPNPLSKLINPWYPSTAVGFEKGLITMVQLERGRAGTSSLRRAATVALPETLIRPSFDEPNISDL